MNKTQAGDIGVFLFDESKPSTLWEYQGVNVAGDHVFTAGRVSTGDFRLMQMDSLAEFWPLCNELAVR